MDPLGPKRKLSITMEDMPNIFGTAPALHDMLVHLIVNASNALPEGGTISIGAKISGDHVELAVSDTGIGMDKRTMEHALEPFFTTAKKKTGSTETGSGVIRWANCGPISRGMVFTRGEPEAITSSCSQARNS
jgi:signal transduction histidine kinase